MIRDLDATISFLLKTRALSGSSLAGAKVSFDLPDGTWRGGLAGPTINCYLYDICENLEMRTHQPIVAVRPDGKAARTNPPIRINCSYCVTAWSTATTDAVLDEHDLLSQALTVLLQSPTLDPTLLQGALVGQIPPYPTVIASQEGVVKHHPQFWTALDQKLKPSLNYVVTLALPLVFPADSATAPVTEIALSARQLNAILPPPPPPIPSSPVVVTISEP